MIAFPASFPIAVLYCPVVKAVRAEAPNPVLCLPELNIKITPKPGDYYFFPPSIKHYVDASTEDTKRYCVVINITEETNWEKERELFFIEKKKDEK